MEMLKELQQSKREKINYLSKFYVISKRLQNDMRYKMENEMYRDDLF